MPDLRWQNRTMRFLAEHPILYITLMLGIGSYIGHLRVRAFGLGPAAVLFTSIGFAAWFATHGITIDPAFITGYQILGEFGLAVFAYLIGVSSGPAFFGSLRTAWRPVLSVVAAMLAGAVVAVGLGKAVGLQIGMISGLFSGALSNTPALAAASQAARTAEQAAQITVGYSLTYLGGVLVMLGAAWFVTRDLEEAAREARKDSVELVHVSIRVERADAKTLGEYIADFGNHIVFSRYRHNRIVTIALDEHRPVPGDIVTCIGPEAVVQEVVALLGHASSLHLPLDRKDVDFRRILVTSKEVAGRTIGELNLGHRYGAVATRVRRGSIEVLATDDLTLALGDRVRVTASQEQLARVARLFGDQERESGNINPISLMVGLSLGILIGAIQLPLPSGIHLQLGNAGGPIVVGLILGRLQRTGKLVWTVPYAASAAMSELGLLLFLVFAGTKAGTALVTAMGGTTWMKVVAIGLVVAAVSALVQLLLGRAQRTRTAALAGQLAGSHTQPAVLVFANERLRFNPNVNLAYSFAYPTAMVAKVLIAPLLVLFIR